MYVRECNRVCALCVCEREIERERERDLLVGWLLNVPATCECTSGTDLLRQLYVLPH